MSDERGLEQTPGGGEDFLELESASTRPVDRKDRDMAVRRGPHPVSPTEKVWASWREKRQTWKCN